MSSSLTRLAMESEGKSARGLFVRRRVAICGAVFVIAAFVAVALLAHYLTSCPCERGSSTPTSSGGEESSAPPAPPTTTPKPLLNVRLPGTLRPLHYELRLQPFLTNFTFIGRVVIQVLCEKDTNVIILHSLNLTLVNESIELAGNEPPSPRITSYDYQREPQFLIFHLDGTLVASRSYNLTLEFNGILADNLVGMYRSKYDDGKWMVTTQFEPTDARRAFPCFDEPAMKATFSVTLVRPKELMSISNMPQMTNESLGNDWVMDIYQETRNMSTYLLAFVITDFSRTVSKSQKGIDVFSRHGAINQTKFAAETGPRCLDFYDNFFNVSYPLPKQDMIAIPDFSAGAMENWGLITYRETTLLFDENISATISKERVAVVIAHELAHQWFGNLVTPLWWDDLWLNEGFATYMENYALDDLFPEWKMMEKFLTRLHSVLEDDSLVSSHPVSVPVHNPEQINEIFDSISYEKGSSIIRMMVNFLGNDVFRQGLQTYFHEKQFGNANQDDLWKHMTQAAKANGSDVDVKKIMDTWTVQMGYPVVKATRNLKEQTVTLEQRRFLLIPDKSLKANEQYKWEIPINFATKAKRDFSKTLPMKWMHNLSTEKTISFNQQEDVPLENEWIIFNVQQTGYYRVNYDDDNWSKITQQLIDDHTVIHVSNRAQLVDDAFNLARAGQLDYKVAMKLIKYLAKEEDYIPMKSASGVLAYIDAMIRRTPAYGKWMLFVGEKLIKPQYDLVKLNNTQTVIADADHIKQFRRILLAVKACHFDLDDCVKTCIDIFNEWMTQGINISPDVRDLVLCKAIEKGGLSEWNFVWEKLNSSNVGSEKESFLQALCCTQEPWLISKLLNMILHPDGKNIRHQDSRSLASAMARNKLARYLLMDFVKDKLEELRQAYAGPFIYQRIIRAAMLNLNTPFELQQLKQFTESHASLLSGAERTMTQIIEETESNVMWMSRNYETIDKWLESQSG